VKIEVLYVAGCPHVPSALSRLREVLASYSLTAQIEQIEVRDPAMARALRFPGSPTIRINGRDISGESECPSMDAMACRLYPGADIAGVPPVEMIRSAVHRACREGGN
jgi:hypothetical protein